jgi:organic hydroperoxide reductase OsmC/OhrA
MQPYPHAYAATARGAPGGPVAVSSAGLPDIATAAPPEFDGPGGVWSPEMLLTAAVADCFILGFRAISRASKFEWLSLECRVEGVLERVEKGGAHFTRFKTLARLTLPPGADESRARLLLEKAEHTCLIANSLRSERSLEVALVTGSAA